MGSSPCRECKRRKAGCHSSCIEYTNYRKRLEQELFRQMATGKVNWTNKEIIERKL